MQHKQNPKSNRPQLLSCGAAETTTPTQREKSNNSHLKDTATEKNQNQAFQRLEINLAIG
jgi:hypothetical protein